VPKGNAPVHAAHLTLLPVFGCWLLMIFFDNFTIQRFNDLTTPKKRLSFIPKHRKLNIHLRVVQLNENTGYPLKNGFYRKQGIMEKWDRGL
jgi:hypothetical protein